MKTKTTGIPFTDYNVNTTVVFFLVLILSLTFSQGVIKLRYSTIHSERNPLHRYLSPARPIESFTMFSDNFNERKAILSAFTTRHVLTFIQLSILPIIKNFRPEDTRATRVTIQIGRAVRINASCCNSGTEINNVRNSHFLAHHYTLLVAFGLLNLLCPA